MLMTTRAIFETMCKAGFPGKIAVTMTAIALRESGGDPNAFNDSSITKDRSYGLLQIDMLTLGAGYLKEFGIVDENTLCDPAINAHAGFVLWNHNNKNLDVAWYILRPGYKERYEEHLPAAQAAALESPMGLS